MIKAILVTISAIILSMTGATAFAVDASKAAEIAGNTGCGILASLLQQPQAAVAAAGACVYGTSVANDLVAGLVDEYFKGEDQAFANKYCLTIVNSDGGKIKPTIKTNCDE